MKLDLYYSLGRYLMIATVKKTINNENGFVLVVAMLILAIVTVIGVGATRTSETELQIASNERQIADDLYDAEAVIIDMLEMATSTWAAPASTLLTEDDKAGPSYAASVDFDDDGTDDGAVEVRCVQDTDADTANANDLPVHSHVGDPPAGSGYSAKHFEVRRYAITAVSTTGSTKIQAGAWKLFNKAE